MGIIRKADIIDKNITNTLEYKGFLDIKDFLGEKEKDRLATKLLVLLYGWLDEETKQLIDDDSIKRYLLNIGFIRTRRISYRKAIDFIKSYPTLFRNEEDVLSRILGGYIDEELTNAPVKTTHRIIQALRLELKDLYRSILQ